MTNNNVPKFIFNVKKKGADTLILCSVKYNQLILKGIIILLLYIIFIIYY